MTQYIRTPFTLLLSALVVLLLLQMPSGNRTDEQNPHAPVLVEGVFELELQCGLIQDPEQDSASALTCRLPESAARNETGAGSVLFTARSPFDLPPSRAPPTLA